MSAPDTNIEKQKRRHRGPLIGMALAVLFGLGLMFVLMGKTASDGQTPEATGAQIDGRTGEAEPVTPPAAAPQN